MSEIEFVDGEEYIIHHECWDFAQYDIDDFFLIFGESTTISPDECDKIIPLTDAIRAPELEAENARLKSLLEEYGEMRGRLLHKDALCETIDTQAAENARLRKALGWIRTSSYQDDGAYDDLYRALNGIRDIVDIALQGGGE